MKRYSKICILALGTVACAALPSCGETKVDDNVASIKIVSDSIRTSFTQGATVSYNNLAIDLFNSSNGKIKTLKWSENKDSISYTTIDTSVIAKDQVFTVTYVEGEKSFSDSTTYSIVDAYSLSSWAANSNYTYTTAYLANSKISTDEDKLENGFMKKGTFYVGNMNEVDLLPELNGLNKETYEAITLTSIPAGASVKLSQNGSEVAVENYIENANTFVKNGKLKFKSNVTGSFKVTLSYSGLADIVYDVTVVDAYNVSKATDMFAFFTSTNSYPYSGTAPAVKAYKEKMRLPDAESLVIQNDITIGKSDLPDCFYWQKGECDAAVEGSLKDWIRIFDHEFKTANSTSTIYGNLHRISFNTDETSEEAFPYILTEFMEGIAQQAGRPVSSHASLFYGSYIKETNPDPFNCTLKFVDLQGTGNAGVSEDSDISKNGPMFLKTEIDSDFDNVLISKFYMAAMVDAGGDLDTDKKIDDRYISPSASFSSCRIKDSGNASAYVYGSGTLNITNTEMVKAGGPLLFLNPLVEKLPSNAADVATFEPTTSVKVNIDDNSFLSNYTAGKGGWFDAYQGASSLAASLQSMDALFTPYSMSFLAEKNSVKKFNLLMVDLPIAGNDSLNLPSITKGGVNVTVKKGNNVVYSTLDGYSDVIAAYAAIATATASGDATSIANAYSEYCDKVSGSFFGNNLAYANIANEITFATTTSDGSHEFAMVNQTSEGIPFLCDSEYALKSGFSQMGAPVTVPSTHVPGEAIKTEGYLAGTINGSASQVYGSSVAASPLSYTGVANYGILLGQYHKI